VLVHRSGDEAAGRVVLADRADIAAYGDHGANTNTAIMGIRTALARSTARMGTWRMIDLSKEKHKWGDDYVISLLLFLLDKIFELNQRVAELEKSLDEKR
jgi:hypothetical protein